MADDEQSRLKPETVVIDQAGAKIEGAICWPPIGAKVELGQPNRDATVREVRLRLFPEHAQACITVADLGEVVPGGAA